MKYCLYFFITTFCFGFFQNGCGNNNFNLKPVNNQNGNVESSNHNSAFSTEITPTNQIVNNNGASYEEARPVIELNERCKHAPVNKARATPVTGTAPLKVIFDGGAAYDPDGTKIVRWQWHFGDGQTAESRVITYVYEKPGKYGIGLNVTDSQGQKTSDCGTGATDVEITVTDGGNINTTTK